MKPDAVHGRIDSCGATWLDRLKLNHINNDNNGAAFERSDSGFKISNFKLLENKFSCGSFGAHSGLQKCDVHRHLYFYHLMLNALKRPLRIIPQWPTDQRYVPGDGKEEIYL